MSQHTPGPWKWREHYQGLYSADGSVIEFSRHEGMWLSYGPHQAANAALIEQAPKLFELLKDLIEFADPGAYRIAEAKEVIAKVESAK
jgi:hypothetical protein